MERDHIRQQLRCAALILTLPLALALLILALTGTQRLCARPSQAESAPPRQGKTLPGPRLAGFALSPYFEQPELGMRFPKLVDEIAETGASDISLVVHWGQEDIYSVEIAPDPKETRSDALLLSLMARARARGLRVLLFPILWLRKQAIGAWRGTLQPRDERRWWESYRRFILHYAALAERGGAGLLSVGSELSSMESREREWRALIRATRAKFSGELIYSANWDHYHEVTFWSALDRIGFTGYYVLSETTTPSLAALTDRWKQIRRRIERWPGRGGRPVVLTELGYPSIDGAAMRPWDYTGDRPVDLEEQRLCFEAFSAAWAESSLLDGVYFWNWWGPGGVDDRWYTLKGKPALKTTLSFLERFQSAGRRQRAEGE